MYREFTDKIGRVWVRDWSTLWGCYICGVKSDYGIISYYHFLTEEELNKFENELKGD